MNNSNAERGGNGLDLMDWGMNGLIVPTSLDPIIQPSTNPFFR